MFEIVFYTIVLAVCYTYKTLDQNRVFGHDSAHDQIKAHL
jgi:hypothetical protein